MTDKLEKTCTTKPATLRKRRSRAWQSLGYRALKGSFWIDDDVVAELLRRGLLRHDAWECDAKLADSITLLLERIAAENDVPL